MRRLKKAPPPVVAEKKKKHKSTKRPVQQTSSKENTEPTLGQEELKMYESVNACKMLNLSQNQIYQELYKHKLDGKQLEKNFYPSEDYPLQNNVEEGTDLRTCDRCRNFFHIADGRYRSSTTCWFHPKKAVYDPWSHVKTYACCRTPLRSPGCTQHWSHVTVQHGPRRLTKIPSVSKRKDLKRRVYGLDCEMCYTLGGLEVTRIVLVDINCKVIYDTYVKPTHTVLDFNTQFSGVEKHHLEHGAVTLDKVKQDLGNFIQDDTILVGHALNNDLSALGLIHKTVVDTSVMFPNEVAPYFKLSLKSLTAKFLNASIQDDLSGHNCIEDARACLQLALLKVRPHPPIPFNIFTEHKFINHMINFSYEPLDLTSEHQTSQHRYKANWHHKPEGQQYFPLAVLLPNVYI